MILVLPELSSTAHHLHHTALQKAELARALSLRRLSLQCECAVHVRRHSPAVLLSLLYHPKPSPQISPSLLLRTRVPMARL